MISLNFKMRILTSVILLTLMLLIFKFNNILIITLFFGSILSIIEFFKIIEKIFNNGLKKILINIFFVFYIFLFSSFFFLLTYFLEYKILIFIILLGCISSDVGGFIFGKFFKGPKLTRISPNKTISGAIGSFFLTSLTILTLFFYTTKNFELNFLILSLITSLSCQIGDLFFSYLKRKAGVKDTGGYLPGHGGILDRLDGILLGLPMSFITFLYIF